MERNIAANAFSEPGKIATGDPFMRNLLPFIIENVDNYKRGKSRIKKITSICFLYGQEELRLNASRSPDGIV